MRPGEAMQGPRRGMAACWMVVASLLLALASAGEAVAQEPARAGAALQRAPGEKVAVTLYEVRSAVPEVPPRAAQDMFITALVRSGVFTVAERQRLNEGVLRERHLGAAGYTAADPAQGAPLAAARYVFEAAVSEANVGERESHSSVRVGGMSVERGAGADSIAFDVRIVDVGTGVVVDAVSVTRKLEASTASMTGVGRLANSIAALRGRTGALAALGADADVRTSRRDGVDRALRGLIDDAVAQLAGRFPQR